MKSVLIISGHPDLTHSTANRTILNHLQQKLSHTAIRDLGQLYPNFQIDVAAEQTALAAADVIVWQFPFYWFSVPALMKKWIDDVHTFGFAYGIGGDKLKGKKLILSLTAGGKESDYQLGGSEGAEISAYLPALAQVAPFCQMEYLGAVYSYEMHYEPTAADKKKYNQVISDAIAHADKVISLIQGA